MIMSNHTPSSNNNMAVFQNKPLKPADQLPPQQFKIPTYALFGIGTIVFTAVSYLLYNTFKSNTSTTQNSTNIIDSLKDEVETVKQAAKRINQDEHKNLAKQYYESKQYNNAIQSYKEAIQYEPHKHTLHTNLANVLHDIKQYTEAIKYADSSLNIKQTANALYIKGRSLIGLKQYDTAIQQFKQAAQHDDYTKLKHLVENEIKRANNYLRRSVKAPGSISTTPTVESDELDSDVNNHNFNTDSDTNNDSNHGSNINSGIFGADTVRLNQNGLSQSEIHAPVSNANDTQSEVSTASSTGPVDLPPADESYDVDSSKIENNKTFASLVKDVPDELKALPKEPVSVVPQAEVEATQPPPPVHTTTQSHSNNHNNRPHRHSGSKKSQQKYVPVKKESS